MARARVVSSNESPRKMRPALSTEARENQLISMAVDLAEKQLRDGTASSQVITHYLKLGTTKAQLEVERERKEMALIDAKIQSLQSQKRSEELFEEAIKAFSIYSGHGESDES